SGGKPDAGIGAGVDLQDLEQPVALVILKRNFEHPAIAERAKEPPRDIDGRGHLFGPNADAEGRVAEVRGKHPLTPRNEPRTNGRGAVHETFDAVVACGRTRNVLLQNEPETRQARLADEAHRLGAGLEAERLDSVAP